MKKVIALLALTLSMTAMADTSLSCFGTEPFWSLKIEENKTVFTDFSTDTTEEKTEEVISNTPAAGTADGYAFVVKTENATANVVLGECNDGMSDNVYSHHILYTTGSQVLYGCCK